MSSITNKHVAKVMAEHGVPQETIKRVIAMRNSDRIRFNASANMRSRDMYEEGDGSAVKKAVEQLNKGIEDFKASYEKKVDDLQASVDAANLRLGAAKTAGGGYSANSRGPSVGASAVEKLRDNAVFSEAREAVADGLKPNQFTARAGVSNNIRAALTNDGKGGETDSKFPSRPEHLGIVGQVLRPLRLLDVLPSRKTGADSVQFIQLDATGDADYQLKEGDEKAEVDFDGELKRAWIATIAAHTTASKQVLNDEEGLQAQIDRVIRHKGLGKLEHELINGAGGSGEINGLINQAQAFVPTIGTTRADIIGEALVTQANLGYQPGLILMNPLDWFRIQLTRKNEEDDEYVFGSPTVPVPPSLWNQRIVTTPSMAVGQAMTIDTGFVTVLDREQMSVMLSNQHKDYFTRNLVLILGELRAGLEVLDTGAIRKFTLPS